MTRDAKPHAANVVDNYLVIDGQACRQFVGPRADVEALVDIALRSTITAHVANSVEVKGVTYTLVAFGPRTARWPF